ncbi:hypothetical protein [Rhizomonospora bruguierae]|uniref:hypothetical protein n=1 Tax=Rhizomonospora bruguierae TaxID=1581705 RepID=UPI001BCAB752|nr:hypothetical protein [Micromonospora sp. NBRC 107566]
MPDRAAWYFRDHHRNQPIEYDRHRPLVQVGQVVELDRADYLNGRGNLKLRITHVPPEASHPSIEWVRLLGVEVLADKDGAHQNVVVRADALRQQQPPAPAARPESLADEDEA